MQIELSVIIPVYNGEHYITHCIDSILSQEDVSLEVIIMDDKSTDTTAEKCKKYANDTRVTYQVLPENRGQGYCRNIGLTLADGEYVLFVDADDYLSDDKKIISKCLKEMESKNLDILDCPYYLINDRKEIKNVIAFQNTCTGKAYLDKVDALSVVVWNKLFKRSFLIENQLVFSPRKYEDVSFNIECFLKADRVSASDNIFYNYLIQENSTMTSTPKARNVKDVIDLVIDLERIYAIEQRVYQVEKTFFYSFIGAARIISRYQGERNEIAESLDIYDRIYKRYRKAMFRSRTLNFILRYSLLISPFLANKVLEVLKK